MFRRLFRRESKEDKQPESRREAQAEGREARQIEAQKDYQAVRRAAEPKEPAGMRREDENLARRERRAAESILENESLAADLDDEAAKELIDWGIASARSAAQSTMGLDDEQAEELMSERLRAARKLMRAVNKLVSKRAEIDTEESAQLLSQISEQVAAIYGEEQLPDEDEGRRAFVERLAEPAQDNARVVADLRGLFEKPGKASRTNRGEKHG